jgi:3-oxoacyl-[acyl-carrier-protein] synthase II
MGHSYAAAGAIDTIAALLALRQRKIPPTMNCEELHPDYTFHLIRERAYSLSEADGEENEIALIGGRGVGGANVALAIANLKDE